MAYWTTHGTHINGYTFEPGRAGYHGHPARENVYVRVNVPCYDVEDADAITARAAATVYLINRRGMDSLAAWPGTTVSVANYSRYSQDGLAEFRVTFTSPGIE